MMLRASSADGHPVWMILAVSFGILALLSWLFYGALGLPEISLLLTANLVTRPRSKSRT